MIWCRLIYFYELEGSEKNNESEISAVCNKWLFMLDNFIAVVCTILKYRDSE